MAELGDLANILGDSQAAPIEITVDMLDYTFIEECDDVEKLRGILAKLQSNEYGAYPQVRAQAYPIYTRALVFTTAPHFTF
jgi:hypothetical protein